MWLILVLIFSISTLQSSSQETDDCKCVAYYLCDKKTKTIITDGRDIIEFGERMGDYCTCNCPKGQVCCRLLTTTKRLPKLKQSQCGIQNPRGIGFKSQDAISNSEQTAFGEFPWFVDIYTDGIFKCGGTLIHPSVVLTAAHCVTAKKKYIVTAGDYDTSSTTEIFKHQSLSVETIKIHENYNPAVFYNDIALLFLNDSFTLNSNIQIACLAENLTSSDLCYVIGRGKNSNIIKKTELNLTDKSTCESQLRIKLKNFRLHRSFICAGDENGADSCIGDGGGPLVCAIDNVDERFQQVGIVSWGIGCQQNSLPAVYTNVAFLRKWIDEQLEAKDIDTNSYQYL